MARNIRSSLLENRSNRLRQEPARKPIFVRIGPGLSLGYRRTQTSGTWVVRVANGRGGAWTKAIGIADDYPAGAGTEVLTFWEAQDRARGLARSRAGQEHLGPITVQQAVEEYLAGLAARNKRSAYDARLRLHRLFLPNFGSSRIVDLSRAKLEAWRDGLVHPTEDSEGQRRARDTANRVLSMVKAALNHAANDPANGIENDSAWRLVRPFRGVGRPREAHFDTQDLESLLKAIDEPCFRDLVLAGFLTGARYGELAVCQVKHFDAKHETLRIPGGKTGARTVILWPQAVTLFQRVAKDRPGNAPLLPRSDGSAWRPSDQVRLMKAGLRRAGLNENATFYALRHSHISRAIESGTPLNILAENTGTSVRMIETTYAKILTNKRREFIIKGAPQLSLTM